MHWIEPKWLEQRVHHVPIKKQRLNRPLRIMHLSDFHFSAWVPLQFIEFAMESALKHKPDLMCITGDFISWDREDDLGYIRLLQKFTPRVPIVACLGNHDGGAWAAPRGGPSSSNPMKQLLEKAGVRVLHNETERFTLGQSSLEITGVGNDWAAELSPRKAFNTPLDPDCLRIVLSHNPDTKDILKAYEWDLMLSGHTHGGQLRLPIIGTPFAPVRDHRFVQGLHTWNDRYLHISKGVGNLHGLRFNCPSRDISTTHRLMKRLFKILKIITRLSVLLYVALTGYGCATFQRAMYPVPRPQYQDGPHSIKLESTDGHLITARFAEAPQARYTLLYSHGNGMDLSYFEYEAQPWLARGINFFAYDYQGYGTSEGTPSEQNTYDDIDAAYRYLTKTRGILPENIIVYGFSLGSGMSCDLAMRKPVGGLILHSPFLSAYRVVTKYPIIPFDKYRNYKKIHKIDCPLLILHGRADPIIPLFHSQALYKKAQEPKQQLWIEGAMHNNCVEMAGKAYWEQVESLIFGSKPASASAHQ